jgi:hypothetical protein
MTPKLDPRPIPGALDGSNWIVRTMEPTLDGSCKVHGYTDHTKREMAVPSAPSTRARWVALHEMGHARFTPTKSRPNAILAKNAPARPVDVQVIEDLRINSRLAHAGLMTIPRDDQDALEAAANHWADAFRKEEMRPDLLEVMTLSLLQAAHLPQLGNVLQMDNTGMGAEQKLVARFFLDRVAADAEAAGKNTESETTLARALANKALEIATTAAKGLIPKRRKYSDPLPHRLIGPAAAHLRRLLDAEKEIERNQSTEPGAIKPSRRSQPAKWGKLLSLPPLPLSETSPAVAASRRTIAAPVGPRLRNIRRILTDGRAFARTITKPQKGGTVLIDTSGSMSLAAAEVHAVLARIPAATVAIYSGRATSGTVSVIAKNGRIASAATIKKRIADAGGGNIVDGPALAWLGQQAEPRLWVCDGVVTGQHDCATRVLDLEAEALRRKHRVARFDTLGELTRHLSKPTR